MLVQMEHLIADHCLVCIGILIFHTGGNSAAIKYQWSIDIMGRGGVIAKRVIDIIPARFVPYASDKCDEVVVCHNRVFHGKFGRSATAFLHFN